MKAPSSRLAPFTLLVVVVALLPYPAEATDWSIRDESPAQDPASPFRHERKLIAKPGSGDRSIEFVWFDGAAYTFRVIDNGATGTAHYPSLAAAMKANGCLLGCNGGFFHPDFAPSGLMVAGGEKTGRFGEGALLSGVLLSSGRRNPYLLRRAEFDAAKYKATDLIQSGPFLVDQGKTVRGLSPENSRRRTFVLHDGGRAFALGFSDPFTLAELGEILARGDLAQGRKIHRALNLDGGSSSGLYFDPGTAGGPIRVEPIKRVRNYLGIVLREARE